MISKDPMILPGMDALQGTSPGLDWQAHTCISLPDLNSEKQPEVVGPSSAIVTFAHI